MPLVIPPSCANWKVTITNGSGGPSSKSSVAFGVFLSAPLTQTDVDRVSNLFRDGLTPRYDNSWLIGPCHVVENDAGTMKVWDDTGTEAGTHAASAYAPPAVSWVITKNTGLSGRRHRGRLFMPGVSQTFLFEDGTINGSEVNAWQSSINSLQTSVVADAAVNAFNLFHDVATPGAGTSDQIVSFIVRNVVGTMRPRQRR